MNTSTDPSSHESAPIRFLVNYMNIVATAVSVCTCVNDTITAVFHSTVCLLCSHVFISNYILKQGLHLRTHLPSLMIFCLYCCLHHYDNYSGLRFS